MAVAIETKNLRARFRDSEGETKPLDQFWSGIAALEREATSRVTDEGDLFMPIAVSIRGMTLGQQYWRVAESSGGDKAELSKPEAVPANLQGFAAHITRDRFPADIEEQIEQAWGD